VATASTPSDELFRAILRLDSQEMERLLKRLLQLRAKRSAPSLSPTETELLSRINEGLPEGDAVLYHALMERRRTGNLTPEQHRELLRLTDVAEAIQAERIQHLAELAHLRGTSLSALVEELGLQPTPDA
jgi:hypothetical protein